jgi:4-alpha-glucanotransferase
VDWLADAGQRWWQVLPLSPPDEVGSPYRSPSSFAGWPGLLARPDAPVDPVDRRAFRRAEQPWIEDHLRWSDDPDSALADQVRFAREWGDLRRHAASRGVGIIGDLPIFVAPDGVDVRAHPELFLDGVVAGVPPDAFSETGQLWGNPLYDWSAMRRDGYRWWVARMRRLSGLVDVARVDHFRAFAAYWAVPEGAPTAQSGSWEPGPGAEPLRAASAALGEMRLIAEDLGMITPDVDQLREELGLPGMRVLQFAFSDDDPANPHRPDRHRENAVAFTGTHDNDTSAGWWANADAGERARLEAALEAAGIDDPEPAWAMVRLALASPARLAVVPVQDLLGLGSEARMNTPGRANGNWTWRLRHGTLTPELAARLREATAAAGRV